MGNLFGWTLPMDRRKDVSKLLVCWNFSIRAGDSAIKLVLGTNPILLSDPHWHFYAGNQPAIMGRNSHRRFMVPENHSRVGTLHAWKKYRERKAKIFAPTLKIASTHLCVWINKTGCVCRVPITPRDIAVRWSGWYLIHLRYLSEKPAGPSLFKEK